MFATHETNFRFQPGLAGNERLKAEGRGDQLSGAARRKKGSLKGRIKGWIDRL